MSLNRCAACPTVLTVGPLVIDLIDRRVTRGGRAVPLRHREYALLLALARHAGTALPEAVLLHRVWGLPCHPGTNLVAVHMSRLRAALDGRGEPRLLRTLRGRGYLLDVSSCLGYGPPQGDGAWANGSASRSTAA